MYLYFLSYLFNLTAYINLLHIVFEAKSCYPTYLVLINGSQHIYFQSIPS